MLVPEEALGEGPHIYIAISEDYFEHVPINATRLLWEWEARLDPEAHLKDVARYWLPRETGWAWGRWFVEPSANALALVRRAAEDHELIDGLEEMKGVWAIDEAVPSEVGESVRVSITRPRHGHTPELNGAEVALLLGMAWP
jgi:hypothetical protein